MRISKKLLIATLTVAPMAALLIPSVASPMERSSAAKTDDAVMITLASQDNKPVQVQLSAAKRAGSLNLMLEDLGPECTKIPIPVHNTTQQTLQSAVDCLNLIDGKNIAEEAVEEEEEICSICRDTLNPANEIQTICKTPCGHNFHINCVKQWIDKQHNCPVCRKPITEQTQLQEETPLQRLQTKLSKYLQRFANNPSALQELLIAANFLDIKPLLDVCAKAWSKYCFSEQKLNNLKKYDLSWLTANIPTEINRICAQALDVSVIKQWLLELASQPKTLNLPVFGSNRTICFKPDSSKTLALEFESLSLLDFCRYSKIQLLKLNRHGSMINAGILNGKMGDFIEKICISSDGTTLAAGLTDGTIKLWKLDDLGLLTNIIGTKCTATLEGHTNWITSLCFSPDGKTLASGSYQRDGYGIFKLWKQDKQGVWICTRTLTEKKVKYWAIYFNNENTILASADWDTIVKFWEFDDEHEGWKQTATLNLQPSGKIYSLCFSPNGKILAIGSTLFEERDANGRYIPRGNIKIYENNNNNNWTCLQTLNGHAYDVEVYFSPDGKMLVSKSDEANESEMGCSTIKLWNHNKQGIWTCSTTLNENWRCKCCISSDSKTLALHSGCDIKLRSLAAFNEISNLFNREITLEQAMLLTLMHQAHSAGKAFDFTQNNKAHMIDIFNSLPQEIRILLNQNQDDVYWAQEEKAS